MRMVWLLLLCGALLLGGCAPSVPGAGGENAPSEEVVILPTNTFVPSPTPSPQPAAEPTETPSGPAQCAWNWAEQALPEVSAELARSLQAAGMENIEAHASAFGENCITGPENTVERFAAMQTDFRLVVPVEKLTDNQELGQWIERVMRVIDAIPQDRLEGPKLGQVSIRFVQGDQEVNLQFSRERAQSLLKAGKTGSALYDALHVP